MKKYAQGFCLSLLLSSVALASTYKEVKLVGAIPEIVVQPETLVQKVVQHSIKVGKKDSLWSLIRKHRVSSDISNSQIAIAIQRKNPKAFVDGNVNLLKANSRLILPSEKEVRAVDSVQAVMLVKQQNDELKFKQLNKQTKPKQPSSKELKQALLKAEQKLLDVQKNSVAKVRIVELEASLSEMQSNLDKKEQSIKKLKQQLSEQQDLTTELEKKEQQLEDLEMLYSKQVAKLQALKNKSVLTLSNDPLLLLLISLSVIAAIILFMNFLRSRKPKDQAKLPKLEAPESAVLTEPKSLEQEVEEILSDDEIELEEFNAEEEHYDSEWSELSDSDAVEAGLDLARAYIDMDKLDSARRLLNEIQAQGTEAQQKEVAELLSKL